jgi:hypothetical protein
MLVGKPKVKRKLKISRCRSEDIIKMNCREIGLEKVYWICQTQDSDRWWTAVNAVINLRIPRKAGVLLTIVRSSFS